MAAKVIKRIYEDPFMDVSSDEKNDALSDYDGESNSSSKREMSIALDGVTQKIFNLETEIQNIPGVKSVALDFSNYKKSGGIWKKKK